MTSEAACRLACEIESEFLCRSFLYMGAPHSAAYNCRLYHLDHHTLPDGPSAYLNAERPLIDDGEPIGKYFENFCESEYPYFITILCPIIKLKHKLISVKEKMNLLS